MNKTYKSPIMEICEFENEDIITASALYNWAEEKEGSGQSAATAELAKSELKEFGE